MLSILVFYSEFKCILQMAIANINIEPSKQPSSKGS